MDMCNQQLRKTLYQSIEGYCNNNGNVAKQWHMYLTQHIVFSSKRGMQPNNDCINYMYHQSKRKCSSSMSSSQWENGPFRVSASSLEIQLLIHSLVAPLTTCDLTCDRWSLSPAPPSPEEASPTLTSCSSCSDKQRISTWLADPPGISSKSFSSQPETPAKHVIDALLMQSWIGWWRKSGSKLLSFECVFVVLNLHLLWHFSVPFARIEHYLQHLHMAPGGWTIFNQIKHN